MHKIQGKFKIVSNKKLCPKFYRLCLDSRSIKGSPYPGQFIHIKVSDNLTPLLRRPFSIHRAKKCVEIFYEVVGKGTQILASKKCGDYLDVLGPLGNGFTMPPKGTRQVVMIAGGIGVAPFLFMSDVLSKKNYELILLYGGRSKDHVFSMKEFKVNGCKAYISTNDGSVGVKGRVSRLFSKINKDSKATVLYACGPKPMLASVKKFAKKHDLGCEASLEEIMACGLGACLSCSIKTKSGYKTVCHDGPVFDIEQIIF